jgi:hypothetical protein
MTILLDTLLSYLDMKKLKAQAMAGFLVINKESGEVVLHRPEELDKPNSFNLITKIRKIFRRRKSS